MSRIGAFGSLIKEKFCFRGMLSSMRRVLLETLVHFKPQSNTTRVSNWMCLSIRLFCFNSLKWLTLKDIFSLLRYNCAEQLLKLFEYFINMEGADTGYEDAPETCLGILKFRIKMLLKLIVETQLIRVNSIYTVKELLKVGLEVQLVLGLLSLMLAGVGYKLYSLFCRCLDRSCSSTQLQALWDSDKVQRESPFNTKSRLVIYWYLSWMLTRLRATRMNCDPSMLTSGWQSSR